MKKKQWIEVTITSPAPYQDLLIGQLGLVGFEGFLQEDASFSCYVPAAAWKKGMEKKLHTLLGNFGKEFAGMHFSTTTKTINERNWNEDWEKSIGIVEATARIIIKPSWKKLRKRDKGKIVLHIDPKMAFGTGHHETTRLSLVLLEEYVCSGARVLDFGSGTGILAIAAVKLGAASALAIDNDPWAVENALENISRNRVPRKVKVVEGDGRKLPKPPFDLIVANIDLPTITKTLAGLVKKLRPQGTLIVSGLLTTDLTEFLDLISHQGIVPLEMLNENEWVAVALIKADATGLH
ncbi:MAG: 50S ribosomal protein L11 methyltransferase [Ignavibacteriales bacterium]|nr:50S ribosomal protein L11 methyltransferase [Ignavibacteriales bacterium]